MHLIFGTDTIDSLSSGVKSLGASFKGYITKLKEAKFETIALKVETVALEAAMTLGITLAISALVSGVNKLIHAEEQAAEEERKFWQTIDDNVDKLNQEETAIEDLIAKYSDLSINSSDNASAREDLIKLQDQMIKDYGTEAESIDLVNGKYSEQIKYLQDLKRKKAEAAIYDEENIKAYNEALEKLNNAGNINGNIDVQIKNVDRYNKEVEEIYGYWKEIGLISDYSRRAQGSAVNEYGFDIEGAENAEVLYQTLNAMAESYKELSTQAGAFNEEQYVAFKQQAQAAEEYYNKYKSFADWYEQNKAIAEFALPEETQKQFDDLLDKAKQLYETINGDVSPEEKFIAIEKLRELKGELYEISSNNTDLTSAVDSLFKSIDSGTSRALEDFDTLRETWLNTLDDMQKGSLKNISTMVSALQDLSEGKGIAANTFWSLIEFDEEGLLNGAKLVGDKFVITEEKMIELKDKYVQKQIDEIKNRQATAQLQKDAYDNDVALYEMEVAKLTLQKKSIVSDEYRTALSNLEKAKAGAKEWGDEIERNNWLIEYLNQTLGNTVDLQKQLEAQQKQLNKELTALNKELDNYTKAYEAKIDAIVKGLELELSELEEQKDVLEDELDVLEKQKDTIEETLDNYEKVNSYVQKIIDKEIDSLEEQRDAIKDTYNERINALKAENDEREDALEYAQKLANLENARNNKRRVYDEARGWRYESVKEDVVKAESDLKTFETNQEVKKLEKERDAEIKAWDELIQKKKDYKDQWASWLEEIQDEESEALLVQELGADARQRIADGDLSLIETFSTQYRKHNDDLKILVDTEIKLKKASIDAKNAEIDAKKKQITAWKDYKTQLTTAVTEIKNANEDYMKQIGTIELDETSSLERRDQEFEKFKNHVTGYIDQIGQKQSMIDNVTAALDQISGGDYKLTFEVEGYDQLANVESTLQRIVDKMKGVQILNAAEIAQMMDEVGIGDVAYGDKMAAFLRKLMGYSSGGVADYTGLAMLHGRKNAPETIFNASDSAKLYEMVHNTPSVMADMLTQANKLAGFKVANNENTNNSNVTFYIDKIVTDNPVDFERQLDRYYRTKLTQSYTSRQ